MCQVIFVICAFLNITSCSGVSFNKWSPRPRWWLNDVRPDISLEQTLKPWELRQRFILDLLLQVHKPLLEKELIEMGRVLNDNPSDYVTGGWVLLKDFTDLWNDGILGPYSIYSQFQEKLPRQLLGVYRFLVLAKDWNTFQRNACYARIHFNPVLFVNALQLAIIKRMYTKDLILPAMHEVLPQLYFDKEVIMKAQLVNWQQLAPIPTKSTKRSWVQILGRIVYPKIVQQPMEERLMPAEPVVIEVKPRRMQLSLDVELNSYWNNLISRLIIGAHGQDTAFNNAKHSKRRISLLTKTGQLFLHNIKQFVALYKLEEIATGYRFLDLIEPTLITTGGVPSRATNLTAQTVLQLISKSLNQMKMHIDNRLDTEDSKMQTMCTVGRSIVNLYLLLCQQLSRAINDNQSIQPTLLGMATSNLRDPIYRMLLLQLDNLVKQYEEPRVVSTEKHGLRIRNIHVGHLETFEQAVDSDLINLMDQQLLQTQHNNLQLLRRRLVARQLRLNHKSFNITYELYAHESKTILIRSYLVPVGIDQHRYLLDSFVSEMLVGENKLERQYPMAKNIHTLSELYEAKQPLNATNTWTFPQHLRLPRGSQEGLRLQLLVEIFPWLSIETHMECESPTIPVLAKYVLDVVIYHQGL